MSFAIWQERLSRYWLQAMKIVAYLPSLKDCLREGKNDTTFHRGLGESVKGSARAMETV